MDFELLMIFMFVLTLVAVGLTFVLTLHRRVTAHEERKLELKARIAEAKALEGAGREDVMQHLEDRMRVLERIVTDPGADLSRQIEGLRHDRTAPEGAAS